MPIASSRRILVTGGAGMIGSAIVWRLNQLGYQNILVADRLDLSEKWRNLAPLRFLDYIDGEDLLTALPQLDEIDTIFHLGACSATTEKDSAFLMRNNFAYTKTLAHWALAKGARFVYASSAATYGAREDDFREALPLDSLRPLNMYGYSKHLFDQYALAAGFAGRVVGLKYFNVFGPNEDHKGDMRSVVHKAFHQIRTTGKLELFRSHRPDFADGCQQRDFLYVKDAVAMSIHLADTPAAGGLFNLGSGHAHTWLDLGRAIFAALDREPNIEFIPMPEQLRGKYQYRTCATIDKLRQAGYTAPITPLADSVADYIRNYLNHDRRLGDESL
ncbi:MAG: ADP-glyceromanno-heptose 6-epimerase [Acidobacteriota bacterium]|jgi:ADP-L-glycero-D-manno-heptose 6-epimerase|nr:ADP-glyceromanno-heptose 6-epimerase [Bryobacteraceae bacterium CoA2 C42]MCA2962286.1 ADP-glyceromanno-heptose 6-epimerase [Acidobacteriaceae bacterium]